MESKNIFFIIIFLIILVFTIGVFALFVTFYNRKNTLLKKQYEDKLNAQKRYHESELKTLQSQLNPHFVHNSLNAIQFYIQSNDVEASEDYLSKFSKLMRLFFDYSRKKNLTLKEEISFLKKYLILEQLRFEDQLIFKIKIDKNLDIETYQIPAMLLQPIVENAINHGIFHKEGIGNIDISFCQTTEKDTFKVLIKDDGIGLNHSKLLQSKCSKPISAHSGDVLKERLAILNESKDWEILYSITDRSEFDNKTGTQVSLTFKNYFLS